jgi:glycopeptide antibiotics resistance protein
VKTLNFRKLFWLYIGAIFLLIALPINSAGELNNITILRLRGDYFFHALMFVPWAFFKPVFRLNAWVWGISGLVFSVGSEGIQYLLPYRAYNVNDLVANMLGVVLGLLLYVLFITFVKPKPQQTG